MSESFTHLDSSGSPRMVDVTDKATTFRTATAEGWVLLDGAISERLASGDMQKGDVLKIAETAGIMAVKRTPDLIPLCHGIRIEKVSLKCVFMEAEAKVRITCSVAARDVTGVEMEAMTGVSVAALTVYDMCKGISKNMTIDGIKLLSKTGGKSGDYAAGRGVP
ncbi:MAG: cyclic pyranopterin monophosphate synthase MoaC [Synergistaceae bacterium]|nr:cyclic pyranopterin monophosphate synthase MoaC [Synergistaceae bacterium]